MDHHHPSYWARTSAVLLLAALATLAATAQAGPVEPPVPPGTPTMRPIDQVNPRIPIYTDDLPLTIEQPGSYYLAEDISASGAGITISSDHVTIDLMGFALRGGTGPAIATNSYALSTTVRNGKIHGWSGAGVALFHSADVSDLIVRSNGGNGIVTGADSRVLRCTADNNDLHGIVVSMGSIVKDCVASDNHENGIWVEQASGSPVSGLVSGCVTDGNDKNGIRVDGNTIVRDNVSQGNNYHGESGKAGIWVNGDANRIENNHVVGNYIGLNISGNYNFIGGNTLRGNVLRNWQTSGTATGNLFTVWNVASPDVPSRWDNIDLGEAP